MKEIDIHIQKAQRILNKTDAKRTTQRHIIFKIPKVKDRDKIFFKNRES